MKRFLLLILLFTLSQRFCFGQNHEFESIDFDTFCSHYCANSTDFLKDLGRAADFPNMCVDLKLSEKIEVMLVYSKVDTSMREFYCLVNQTCFESTVDKMESVFLEHVKPESESFILKFFIHFDLEPFVYPVAKKHYTHNALLYNDEIIVVQKYLPPVIKAGG
jgi:hypothetical protein